VHNRPLVLISFLEDKKTSVIVLLIIGFLIYFNSLFGEFVWDDKSQIVYNPIVHSVGNIPQFFLGSTFTDLLSGGRQSGIHYRPIMSSIFAVLYSIFGPKPFFFHLIPVTLHVVNSILILFLMRNFLTKYLAFILALIFLVHPMNVEVVSYISALHDVLFLTFGLSAFLVLLRSEKDKPPFKLIMVFLLLSLFSKITGVLFFLILGIYLFLFKKTYLRQFIFLSLLTVGIFFLFRVVLAGVVAARIPDIPIMRISFLERMRNVPPWPGFTSKHFSFPKIS
jgi:protein O-mannosyl-transferase